MRVARTKVSRLVERADQTRSRNTVTVQYMKYDEARLNVCQVQGKIGRILQYSTVLYCNRAMLENKTRATRFILYRAQRTHSELLYFGLVQINECRDPQRTIDPLRACAPWPPPD